METRLPVPKNWQDFELLCHKLWREIWNDPQAQRNGRQGQPQNGVDIWGTATPFGYTAGVQCKDKDGRLGSDLTVSELKDECKKAESFMPDLEEFTVATTAPRDGKIQSAARLMNESREHPFDVHVWSWDDIEEELRFRPTLASAYYPQFEAAVLGERKLTLSLLAPRNQITAFFSRPEIEAGMARGVRDYLIPVAFEFVENAFRHGKASRFSIECDKDAICFEDDGIDFDPVAKLDSSKASPESYIGSFIFDVLRRRFGSELKVSHERVDSKNRLTFLFSGPLSNFPSPQRMEIHVDLSNTYSRPSAYRLAASIPISDEVTEITLVITGSFIHSGVGEFFIAMARRLKSNMRLKISMPDSEIVDAFRQWFKNNPQVEFFIRGGE